MVVTIALSPLEEVGVCADAELEQMLSDARRRTGRNFRIIDEGLRSSGRWWWRREWHVYVLVVHVGGMLPWQRLAATHGAGAEVRAYLYGYLQGLDDGRNPRWTPQP